MLSNILSACCVERQLMNRISLESSMIYSFCTYPASVYGSVSDLLMILCVDEGSLCFLVLVCYIRI